MMRMAKDMYDAGAGGGDDGGNDGLGGAESTDGTQDE